MNSVITFLKSLDKINVFVGVLMVGSTIDSYLKGQWVWVVVCGGIAAANFWMAIPRNRRLP